MRIGVCTSDFKTATADEMFAKVKKHGFEIVHLSLASIAELGYTATGQIEIPDIISDDYIKTVSEAAKKYNISIASCNGTFNMAHPDIFIRNEGVRRFEILCDAAKKLGADILSLCSGTRYSEYLWTYHKDNNTEEAWADMIDTVKKAARIAERYDITLAIETEAANVIDTPEKARKAMDEIDSDKLKMVIDCANLFHMGKAKRENVAEIITHAFEVFGKDIVSAHGKDIKESDGIEFCPTGEGIVDFRLFIELLRKYNYKGDMLLHGIYDEDKMADGIAVVKNAMMQA